MHFQIDLLVLNILFSCFYLDDFWGGKVLKPNSELNFGTIACRTAGITSKINFPFIVLKKINVSLIIILRALVSPSVLFTDTKWPIYPSKAKAI